MSDIDDLFRKISFLSSVHALVLVDLLRSKEVPQHIVMDLMMANDQAFDLAETIPPGRRPAMAAFEFVQHYMMMYAEDRAVPGYEKPDWLPEPKASAAREDFDRHTEWFIDGEWVTADPRWEGLPGETILQLDIAALLRERPALRPIEIAEHLKESESRVLTALNALKRSRDVKVVGRPAQWSLAQSVLDDLAFAELRRPKTEPESSAPQTIRTRIILALQSRPRQRYHELAAAVSVSESYIRKHLHDMAQAGLVEASQRPARWSLVKSEKEKRRPKPKMPQERALDVLPAPPPVKAAKPAAARKPRRELPKGLGKPLNVHIVNDIVAVLSKIPAQQYFTVAVEISIAEDTIRRYLYDLEGLGVVQQVGQRPKRWSLTAGWADALKKALTSAATETKPPKRLARAGRSAPG